MKVPGWDQFFSNTRGNVSILFGVSAVCLFACAGAAMDLVQVNDAKERLASAADASALAAVARAVELTKQGTMTRSAIKADAEAYASTYWLSNATENRIKDPHVTVTATNNGMEWTAKVAYNGQFPTSFMGIVNKHSMPVSGSSVASSAATTQPWEVSFLIDTSSSMGLGATDAEMDAMTNDPNIACAFACHWDTGNADTLAYAHSAGYRLRVDVVDDAIDNVVSGLQTKFASDPGDIKAALYGMNLDVDTLVPLNSDLNLVKSKDITLKYAPVSEGNTNYRASMAKITNLVKTPQTAGANRVLLIITDGVHDTPYMESNVAVSVFPQHNVGTMDPAFCETLKSAGVTIGVLQVNYKVPPAYQGYVSPFEADIAPSLTSCASAGLYHQADTPEEINAALQSLMNSAFEVASRITK